MRPKTCFHLLGPLLKRPFFTSKQTREIGIPAAVLSHYVKIGKLKRIRRGIYRSAKYQNPSISRWEDLIQTVYSVPNGIVCLISALAVYDLTDEIPRKHWIGIRHNTTAKSTTEVKIVRFRDFKLGKTEMELEGMHIPIFDRERTIIDAFRLLSRETAIKALKMALTKSGKNRLDLKKLEAYAKRLRFNIAPYLLSVVT
jgi:predicted transcriptional regulator of viral defense system